MRVKRKSIGKQFFMMQQNKIVQIRIQGVASVYQDPNMKSKGKKYIYTDAISTSWQVNFWLTDEMLFNTKEELIASLL